MGRRSRQRSPSSAAPQPTPPRRRAAPRRPPSGGLDPVRKTLAAFLVAAGILGVLTIVGIGTVGGVFGPFLVLAAVSLLAVSLWRNVGSRLDGMDLSDEDRLIRLLAHGVLATAIVLAFVNAVVSTAVG